MDISYMESVIWAFKELWKKGLIYEKDKVMPYSWKAETPISNFETRLDDSYRERTDPAVTVKVKITDYDNESSILIWTTTPWTLPSNLAIAVNEDFDYLILTKDGENLIIGEFAFNKYSEELDGFTVLKKIKGVELVGLSYESIFPYFKNEHQIFKKEVIFHTNASDSPKFQI